MKSSHFSVACAAFVLSVGGCADNAHQASHTVPQKQAASQTPTYTPYYQSSGGGQNVATSRLQNQPVVPGQAAAPASFGVVAPPTPVAPAVAPAPRGKLKAAILLPLSGKNAALGQAMLNAAQQAVFDAAGNNFELQPRDTAGSGGAQDAARTAVNDGAQMIIGPLFASDVSSVKLIAQVSGLQMLPLSTDTSLAERGVYVMGHAPGAQVERVVAYAAAHGAHNFAAVVPVSPYGALVGQVFLNAVAKAGGNVVAFEKYDATAPDAGERIKALTSQPEPIDALLLPESGEDLKKIADQLATQGLTTAHTHILGTGLWDVAGIGRLSPLLVGGWYAAPDPALRSNFIAGYTAAYSQEPPRLATLAYDATALAAVLAKHGDRFDETSLTNPNGFAGLDGIFRLTASGAVERALAVNEVTPDSARVIDAAPSSFVAKAR